MAFIFIFEYLGFLICHFKCQESLAKTTGVCCFHKSFVKHHICKFIFLNAHISMKFIKQVFLYSLIAITYQKISYIMIIT